MSLNMGGFAQDKEDVQETKEKEIIQDKYTGARFEIERNNNFITIMPHIINDIGCHHILEKFYNLPFLPDECYMGDSNVLPTQDVIDANLSYKYHADHNKDHATFMTNTKEFDAVIDVMGHLIPDHPDFQRITYMQVVQYHEDAFFPFHRDTAEETDFGTCICQLNEEYKGGQLNVQGNYIANNQGTITFFNNSTEMWHGVEPIYEGTRFVLLIWFGREEHDSQMQPVSEGTESGDSEVSLASEEQ